MVELKPKINSQAIDKIYDVVIVGGGMNGSSLALAMSQMPLKVAVIEPYAQNAVQAPGFDARAIALSFGTERIFTSLGLWQAIKSIATAIEKIHISDKGHLGITRLKAKQFNISAMGQVVELQQVGKILHAALANTQTRQYCPAKLIDIRGSKEAYKILTLEVPDNDGAKKSSVSNIQIKARLVVGSDGNQSKTREFSDLKVSEKAYDQVAIISTLQTQKPHQNVAYERFTESGPVAFLPLSNDRISMVWMVSKTVALQLETANDQEFIAQLQQQFGYRLGKITRIGKRHVYPLNLVQAEQSVADRLVLIGNAAQSLHPIAGQGFNLGIRDVACLVDCIREAIEQGEDIGSKAVLKQYQSLRQADKNTVIGFTDSIARLFANPSRLLSTPRNTVLIFMNLLPSLKSFIAEAAMGLTGRQSRLARGLSLKLDAETKHD